MGVPNRTGRSNGLFNISAALAFATTVIGMLVMVGWIFDLQILKSIHPAWVTMKPNTAAGFIFLGLSLLLRIRYDNLKSRSTLNFSRFLAVAVALLGMLTLFEYIFGWNPGIDQLLFVDTQRAPLTLIPGRMAPNTTVSFMLLGCALLLIDIKIYHLRPAQCLALLAGLIGFLALMGPLYGVSYLFTVVSYTTMAVNSAIAFIIFAVGLLCARPEEGIAAVVSCGCPGGTLMRRFMPYAILSTIFLGWLVVQGEHLGLFDHSLGISLLVVLVTLIFTTLVFIIARSLHIADHRRRRSEEALLDTNKRLALLSDIASMLLMSESPQAVINNLYEKVSAYLNLDAFFNFLVDEKAGKLRLNACAGIPEDEVKNIEWLDYGVAVCGCVARDGCRIVAENILETPDERTELVKLFGIQAYCCHPLLSQGGKVIGTLSFGTRSRPTFTSDEISLMKAVCDQVAIAMEHERLYQRERKIANTLQAALIPNQGTYTLADCDIVLKYEPALKEADVGGDFYDVFELEDGLIGVLIGDVAGKGLPAAMRVASARHTIRSYAFLDPRPGRVMSLANDALCKDRTDGMHMLTALFAVVDTRSGTLTYSSAGHEPQAVLGINGDIERLGSTGLVMGIKQGITYQEVSVRLNPGDRIVLFTDGIPESRRDRNLFQTEGVEQYLKEQAHLDMEELASGLLDAARSHAGGALKDDAAVIILKSKLGFLTDWGDTYHIELRNDDECLVMVRRELEARARLAGFKGRDLWDIVSAVFEAVVNSVTHGSIYDDASASLDIRVFDDRFEAEITDNGDGFICPASISVPSPTAPRGRGIPMMKTFMDEVNFRNDDGCKVTLTKYLRRNA